MENICLSICMIVKNEERCLERCLKSLQPLREQLPCEVIVTDTGSTDRTIEIAEKYADKILHFTWCNDFSAARNAGIEEAKGEWIMVLDADEELVEDISPLVQFFNSEERHQYYGCHCILKNCNDIELLSGCESLKEYQGDMSDFLAYRIFNMAYHPRYVGEIHECIPIQGPTYTFSNIIYHDGYAFVDKKAREKKGQRNAASLELELKKNIHDLRLLVHILAEEVMIKEDIFKRLVVVTEDTMYHNLQNMYTPIAFSRVAKYYWTKGNVEKALEVCSKYLKYFADKKCEVFEIDIRYVQIGALFQQKQYQPTLKMIERYLTLLEEYEARTMDLSLLMTGGISCSTKSTKNHVLLLQIICYINLKNTKKAGELVRALDIETLTTNVLQEYVRVILYLIYKKDAEILLANYYPIVSHLRREGIGKQKKSAEKAYDMIQEHVKNAPEHIRAILLRQIASTEEGKRDLREEMEREKAEKEETVQKARENWEKAVTQTKETILQFLAEPSMEEKALELIKQLKGFAAEDREVQDWIANLPIGKAVP